jgi:hypothetical protein
MKARPDFARDLAQLQLSHVDRAVALLWYYRQSEEHRERSASELAVDLQEEGFPKPNVTRLSDDLKRSRFVVGGRKGGNFRIDLRQVSELDTRYLALLGHRRAQVTGAVLPPEITTGIRTYLERLAHQINGAYEFEFFDACAVLCRRLMESLVIEVYVHRSQQHAIQQGGSFFPLDRLLAFIKGDRSVVLGRTTPKAMDEIKQLGDTAAHDRTYITTKTDIDDVKARYRKLISELLVHAGIRT